MFCNPPHKGERDRREIDDANEKNVIDEATSPPTNLLTDLQNFLRGAAETIRNVISVKEEIAKNVVPVVQQAGDTIRTLVESGAIDDGIEFARSAAESTSDVVTAVSQAGEAVGPVIQQTVSVAGNVTKPLMQIIMCTVVCSLQEIDERVKCQKNYCAHSPR